MTLTPEPSYAGCVMTVEERIDELCERHGGLRATARVLQIDPGYLSCVKRGKKKPSDNLLKKLGLKQTTYYQRL